MARPRKKTFTMLQYTENVNDGYISNNFKTQRFPKWKPIVDGLAVTILNDDYIAPIILAENEDGQTQIVDGGSRTAAYMMIRYGNYKIKSSVEDPIIKYKSMSKDEKGKVAWTDATFDIRNKTYEQFPKELQKAFDEYQVETVIHECNTETVAKYLRRYNIHTGMNANEKMFIYLPNFADEVREITNRNFFVHNSAFTDSEKEKGLLERVVSESVMTMFYFDKWNKNGKKLASFLNNNAQKKDFEVLNSNIERLENIITEETKSLFNNKNSFIWFTFFNQFTKLGLDDSKFAEFLHNFVNGLRNTPVDGKFFDTVDELGSTKDKLIIKEKLHILETLMKGYLHIEDTDNEVINEEEFIAEILELDKETIHNDMDFYKESLKDLKDVAIKDGSKLLQEDNNLSLLAMVVYSYKEDVDLDEWLTEYAKNNNTYFKDQKKNYLHMVKDLEKNYMEKNEVA
jgi:hypothetical protein